MFSVNYMPLRKKTFDKSGRYTSVGQKTKEGETKPKTIKVGSVPRKKNKRSSKNNKKFLKNLAAAGFAFPK